MLSLTKGGITMATIRSYTTIEQSRKLAEFLPIESADMCWYLATKGNPKVVFNEGYNKYGDFEMPCWSLTALLELIPLYTLEQTTDGKVIVVSEIGQYSKCSEARDNPIDAAFEIVCWLIEQKHIKVNK